MLTAPVAHVAATLCHVTIDASHPSAAFGVVGAPLRTDVAAALTLLDSRPASEEGSCMDPARFPHAPHPPRA